MGRDYILEIKTKKTNETLIKCFFNQIKSFYDVDYQFKDNDLFEFCCTDTIKLDFDRIINLKSVIEDRISRNYENITKIEFQKCCSKSSDIKDGFDQDILDARENIKNLFYAHSAMCQLIGLINAVRDKFDINDDYYYVSEDDIEIKFTVSY